MNDQDAKASLNVLTDLMTTYLSISDVKFERADLVKTLNEALVEMDEAHRFEAFVVDGVDGDLILEIRDRPAVERLADLGE